MHKRPRLSLSAGAFSIMLLAALGCAASADAIPKVIVSIAPVHSLVAAVMRGVAMPRLLVPPGASPHAFALRPSDVHDLHDADLVIWVGESLERFLVKPLSTLDQKTAILAISESPDIELLNAVEDDDGQDGEHAGTGQHTIDLHVWLDPDNARTIVQGVAQRLARIDPANAKQYKENAERTLRRLVELDAELRRRLAPVAQVPYIVFHDAYRYFEEHYGLHSAGSITTNPEISPGARRIVDIRERIETRKVRCVFREPQFPPALVHTVIEDTGARLGILDPEGADIPPGRDAYFILMQRLADSLAGCLARRDGRLGEDKPS